MSAFTAPEPTAKEAFLKNSINNFFTFPNLP